MSDDQASNNELRGLVERAAGPRPPAAAPVPTVPMIAIRIGARWLAIPAGGVREVVTMEAITKVPGVADHVLGVALIRGRLVPVADLSGLLGLTHEGAAAVTRPRLVVLARDEDEVGVVVDEARGVLELPPATTGSGTIVGGLVTGELRWNGNLVAVLDAEAVVDTVAEVNPS